VVVVVVVLVAKPKALVAQVVAGLVSPVVLETLEQQI
jgi:hypothetical protein